MRASARVYIIAYFLMYSREPFIRRWAVESGDYVVQFSLLDLACRLRCPLHLLREQLDRAVVIGLLETIRREGNNHAYRVVPITANTPTAEEHREWAVKWGSKSVRRPSRARAPKPRAGKPIDPSRSQRLRVAPRKKTKPRPRKPDQGGDR